MATVVPLVPMQGPSTNLRSICQRDPNSHPSNLCNLDWNCVSWCRRAPPCRDIISSLSCRVVYPFLCCSCLCPCLCLPCLCLCACQACFCFCRPCQTIHLFDSFVGAQFSFDSLSTCVRELHTMNSFLVTFDLVCPSPTNPSAQAACFCALIEGSPFCRASSVD